MLPGRRQLPILLAILAVAALGAVWLIVAPGDESATDSPVSAADDDARNSDDPTLLDIEEEDERATARERDDSRNKDAPELLEIEREGESVETGTEPARNPGATEQPPSGSSPPATPGRTPGASPGRNPGSTPGSTGSPAGTPQSGDSGREKTLPRSARDPTPRERAARERYTGAKIPSGTSFAGVGEETETEEPPLDLSKLAEPEIWAEYWAREGYSPPGMVKTPVRGKLMSLLTNQQLPGATVRIFTFFPATSLLSGPVLPVVMETTTDEKGFFTANLPAPERWPSGYPRLAISVDFEGGRIIDGKLIDGLRAGEDNELGIFWTPEEPYELEASVTAPEPGLTAVPTGRIDPRRWEARRAKAIFPHFLATPVGAGKSKVLGTWDFLEIFNPPFVTLLRQGEPVLTRQCVVREEEKAETPPEPANPERPGEVELPEVPEIGTPFQPIVFPNDGYQALSGTVVDGGGQPIEGAVLKAAVDDETRVAYTDSTGWFEFFGLPDKTLLVRVTHDLYVGRDQQIPAGTVDATIQLPYLRPRIALNVVSDATDEPVSEIWLSGTQITSPYAEQPKGAPLPTRHMESATGEYLFEHDQRVTFLRIQSPGFKPVELEVTDEQGQYDLRLREGLVLERAAKNYDNAQTPSQWTPDEDDGPGIYSLNDDHWVEYAFDFGEDGGAFDILVDVTNKTWSELPLDNEYKFEVKVEVDGIEVVTLFIASDPETPQTGRFNLGNLEPGSHTIRLTWLNDRYIPGQLDANIRYERIRLMEVLGG